MKTVAETGDSDAQYNLAVMYRTGRGTPQDYRQAAKWYTRAAKQGHVPSQMSLGRMYRHGMGVPQNYIISHMWLNIAATSGDRRARDAREIIAKKLSRRQVEEAQQLASEYFKNH